MLLGYLERSPKLYDIAVHELQQVHVDTAMSYNFNFLLIYSYIYVQLCRYTLINILQKSSLQNGRAVTEVARTRGVQRKDGS